MKYNKQQILERLKNEGTLIICVLCNNPEVEIHHKDGNRLNNQKENLLLLCSLHHKQIHRISKSGREIKCPKCDYDWIYSGKSQFYVTCPRCYNKVNITKLKNKQFNEGICKCGHHSKHHSYSLAPKCSDLECDKCNCQNYAFDKMGGEK